MGPGAEGGQVRILYCDFCSVSEADCKMLIKSELSSYICEVCVQACAELVKEKLGRFPAAGGAPAPGPSLSPAEEERA